MKLYIYLPVSVEIQRAVGLDEAAEAGISQDNGCQCLHLDECQKGCSDLFPKFPAGNLDMNEYVRRYEKMNHLKATR